MAGFIFEHVDADYVDDYVTDYKTDVINEMLLASQTISLNAGVIEYHPVDDIYREIRFIRAHDTSLRVVDMPVTSQGNVTKGGGRFTARLAVFADPWKITPHPAATFLSVTGEQISDIGTSGAAIIDFSGQNDGVSIAVEYAPPDTEIIEVQSGSGLSAAQDLKLTEVHGQVRREIHINPELIPIGNGYQQTPFNNWTSAVDFAEANNIPHLVLMADAVVDRMLKNFTIVGIGVPVIDLNGQVMDKTIVERCELRGSYAGTMEGEEVALVNVSGLNGVFISVSAFGTLTVADNAQVLLSRVVPAVAGQPFTLNMNGTATPSIVAIYNLSGGITIDNMQNAGDTLHIMSTNGEITINSTCTAGNIVVDGNVIDNSTGTVVRVISPPPPTVAQIWDEVL